VAENADPGGTGREHDSAEAGQDPEPDEAGHESEPDEASLSDAGGAAGDARASQGPADDPDHLRARLAVLEAENDRLREEYARARRSQYRRTAIGLGLLGVLALAGTVLAPEQRTVLFALAGTGLFAAVLTWTLTPEEFVAASVGEQVTAAHAADRDALRAELGLQNDRIYVPDGDGGAKLFLPQHPEYELPEQFDRLLLVPDEPTQRGVALTPTGAPLHASVRESMTGVFAEEPGALAGQLADAVVESLELARSATVAPDRDGDGVAVRIERPTFGDLDATDHPVVSTIATGLAVELDRPVAARLVDDDRDGTLVAFEFEAR